MASVITTAGEKLFAAKAQANEQLDIDTFIFANVPAQDPAAPINRDEGLPTDHVVHQQIVQQVGRINENVVVYSTVLDSITGPFEFNWVGLYSSVNQTLVAINHIPSTAKTITVPGAAGNTLNRNFGIEYSGIADLTGINVAPETWQLDFTARLSGMDELTRQLAKDINGSESSFIDDGFKVVSRSTANTFSVLPGVGYVNGLRVELLEEQILIADSYPKNVYVDAYFEGEASSVWKPKSTISTTNDEITDYIDENGKQHYLVKIAIINAVEAIEDLRVSFTQKQDGYVANFKTINDFNACKHLKAGLFIKIASRGDATWELVQKEENHKNSYKFITHETLNLSAKIKEKRKNLASELGVIEGGDSTSVLDEAINDRITIMDVNTIYKSTDKVKIRNIEINSNVEIIGMENESTAISTRDKNLKFIGLQHNYNEEKSSGNSLVNKIESGDFLPPPISNATARNEVEIMAHWYNDFGLESTRAKAGAGGWVGWYTWEWNHTLSSSGYDPKRHPVLGWYRGDDRVVLDWQCYWLREAGLTGVILQATSLDTDEWQSNTNSGFWLYQLFKNTPNFKGLSYVIGGPSGGEKEYVKSTWNKILNDIYMVHGNYQVINVNGKNYPAIYLHDVGTLRAGTFINDSEFEAWLKSIAEFFKSSNFDGVFVYGRNAGYYTSEDSMSRYSNKLAAHGVVMVETGYGDFSGEYQSAETYSDYVEGFGSAYDANKFRRVPNVLTSKESKGHPSNWTAAGSTPDLFRDVLEKAANAVIKNSTCPSIITVYNVAEWAEGGASLQPNVADGWGYLDAVRGIKAGQKATKQNIAEMFYDINLADIGLGGLNVDKDCINIYSTYSITLNSNKYLPLLAEGNDGQEILIMNTANAGDFNIFLVDESNTPGSRLFLESSTLKLGPWSSVKLKYSKKRSGWVQISHTQII